MTDKDYTHLALIVDRSGSMSNIAQDMNGGIKQLLADQAKEPGYCVVDITTFDTLIEHPYEAVRPDDVKGDIIVPRGGTALNDAIGVTIVTLGERFAKMPEEQRPGLVICVVVTDGQENSSKEYTTEQAKALVERQQKEWGWQFIFLAANVDAFDVGGGYGFAKGSTMNFAPSSAGVTNSYASASRKMSETRVATASGLDNTVEFDESDREEAMEK
jgi:uncharacterized protein YegL